MSLTGLARIPLWMIHQLVNQLFMSALVIQGRAISWTSTSHPDPPAPADHLKPNDPLCPLNKFNPLVTTALNLDPVAVAGITGNGY